MENIGKAILQKLALAPKGMNSDQLISSLQIQFKAQDILDEISILNSQNYIRVHKNSRNSSPIYDLIIIIRNDDE